MREESSVASTERARQRFAADTAWLASWSMAVAMACGGGPAVDPGTACGVGVEVSASIAASLPAGHRDPAPLGSQPLTETEISDDEVDPTESSSYSWSVMSPAVRAAGRTADAGLARRVFDSSILVANAADLSRLCRLLL